MHCLPCYKGCETLRCNRVLILVATAAMLVAATSGNAFAWTYDWSYSVTDNSKLESGSASYRSFITDRLTLPVNNWGRWENSLTVFGSTKYYCEIVWALTDGSGTQGNIQSQYSFNNGDGFVYQTSVQVPRTGSYECGVCHWYETTPGGSGPNTGTRGMPYTAT